MIISHENQEYKDKWAQAGRNKYNGAYFYSKEIVKNIIPNVDTTKNWITINVQGVGCDHAIVFIHNNLHPENYDWLSGYDDLVLVCGVKETMPKVAHLGTPIYLPLSVDVAEVERYRRKKTKDTAYIGRRIKRAGTSLPPYVDCVEGLPRSQFLSAIAQYQRVYAVGRCAIEAKVLGCEILAYDPRYPNPARWEVLDNQDAVEILQAELDKIDGR